MVGTAISSNLQRLDRPGDGDRIRCDDDLCDEAAGVALSRGGIGIAQLRQNDVAEPSYGFGGDASVGRGQLPFDQQAFLLEIGAAGALRSKTRGEVGVAGRYDPLLDEVEHVLDCAFDPGALSPQGLKVRLTVAHCGRAVVEQIGQKLLQPLWAQQTLRQCIDHDRLELLVADARALAGRLAATQIARAPIVAVATALSGRDGERMTALGMSALGDSGEHGWPGHEGRRRDVPSVPGDTGLDLEPFAFWDDGRDIDDLPFLFRALDPVAGVVDPIDVLAAIGGALEDVLDVGHVPLASAQSRTARVKVADDLFVAHRAVADPDPLHAIDLLDLQCLGRFDRQPLLRLGTAHLGDCGDVAKRRDRPVPKPGFGVALHRVARELSGLARLVLVEVGQHGADEVAFGILADLLRDCDDANTRALKLAAVMFEQIMVAEEAGEAVHADLGDAAARTQRMLDQCLKAGPVLGRPAEAAVAVDIDQFNTALGVMRGQQLFLVVETDAAIGLTLRGDANVAERTFNSRLGH